MSTTQWIIESCKMQNATEPEDYIGMTVAMACAKIWSRPIDEWLIHLLGGAVNDCGYMDYRWVPATFADGSSALEWQHIPRQMELLLANMNNMTPEEFYQLFEEIHPFIDGNGRVGAILYNILRKTLENPIHPPEFKK